jgi:hypothetical protein
MKIAFYMDEGVEQIVLTPESEFERDMLKKMHEGSRELTIKLGGFYNCQGGWIRHSHGYDGFNQRPLDEQSTIIVLRPKPTEPPAEAKEFPTLADLNMTAVIET